MGWQEGAGFVGALIKRDVAAAVLCGRTEGPGVGRSALLSDGLARIIQSSEKISWGKWYQVLLVYADETCHLEWASVR